MSIEQLQFTVFPCVLKILPMQYFKYAKKLKRQIIFELIKDYYLKSEHNSKTTIYKHCEGAKNDEVIKRYSRYLKYADYYRTINNEFLKEYAGADITELTRPPMTKLEDHFKGVYLSEYQFLQLDCICDIPLLRDIISKRITSVKKISNTQLQDMLDEYRKKLLETKPQESDDNSYLMRIFNLFSLESRYQVLSVYKLASLLSKYNNSQSKMKFSDEEKAEMIKLFGTLVYENTIKKINLYLKVKPDEGEVETQKQSSTLVDEKYIIENTMLPIRLKIIAQLSPGNVNNYIQHYNELLKFKSQLKNELSLRTEVKELLSSLTQSKMRKFIDEEYNISELLEPNFEWSSKKEQFVREIYKNIIMDYLLRR